jgi:hypothetical protein
MTRGGYAARSGLDRSLVRAALRRCAGFRAVARDGRVGTVETPIFPPDGDLPDYLVLRTGLFRRRRPVVAVSLIEDVDPWQKIVVLRGPARAIAALPEHLPLAL